MQEKSKPVLISGVTGFVGMNCVLVYLEKGYAVRGTVRNESRAKELKETLSQHTSQIDNLEFVNANLLEDNGWDIAIQGCEYVLHVASPFPSAEPKNEDELIIPAREGTLRVLRSAAKHGVKRVVLTSSVAAVAYGHTDKQRTFTEADWSNWNGNIPAYQKSKTLAEKAAWEFIEQLPEDQHLELTVINPGLILGPVLDAVSRTSTELEERLLTAGVPGLARIKFGLVDVRDVAQAHYLAMTIPEAAGNRFICVADSLWIQEIAEILRQRFAQEGYNIPNRVLPSFLVHLVGLFDPTVRNTAHDLDKDYSYDNQKIRQMLGWQPRPIEDTIIEMGESMIKLGMV